MIYLLIFIHNLNYFYFSTPTAFFILGKNTILEILFWNNVLIQILMFYVLYFNIIDGIRTHC